MNDKTMILDAVQKVATEAMNEEAAKSAAHALVGLFWRLWSAEPAEPEAKPGPDIRMDGEWTTIGTTEGGGLVKVKTRRCILPVDHEGDCEFAK